MLWKILKILGVPDNLIEVLKKLCTDVTINLRVGEKLEQFLSTSGVKQGDNVAPVLFIFVIPNSLDKKWEFETPDLRWYEDTQAGKPRGQLRGTNHSNKGTKFSFFKSYYVDDTAFILLSREELVTASKLIVSHFRRFGLTIHTGVRSKNEGSKRRLFIFLGVIRNHRLLIQRILKSTTTDLCPSAPSSSTWEPISCLNSVIWQI
jgi:hypothetical protein